MPSLKIGVGIVISLLGNPRPSHPYLDRPNWTIGKADGNVLVLAVITTKFRPAAETREPAPEAADTASPQGHAKC